MSNISSSSYYSASSGTGNNGIPGLASGMDTEAMVNKMLSGTQAKIDKQEGLKQQDLWRQEMYRDITSTINNFYGKYFNSRFGASSVNNFANQNFFNTMGSKISSGDSLKVISSSSSAFEGDMKIAVKQLATSGIMTSDVKMSAGKAIEGKAMLPDELEKAFQKHVKLVVNEAGGTPESTDIKVDLSHTNTSEEVVDAFNLAFQAAGKDVTAKIFNGRLRFVTGDAKTEVSVDKSNSSELGLKMAGFTSLSSLKITNSNGEHIANMLQGSEMKPESGISFSMSLDGVQKTIELNNVADSTGKITADSIKGALQAEVKRAFGAYVAVTHTGNDTDGYKFQFALNVNGEAGHELKVTGTSANSLGISPGSSTSVNATTKLSELGASGNSFSFTINGKKLSFSGSNTIGDVISKVNSSNAGVRLSYSTISDTFKLESSSSGEKYDIEINQTEGNLLSVMFGTDKVNEGSSAVGKEMLANHISGEEIPDDFTTDGASMVVTVNGKSSLFTLPREDGVTYSKTDIETKLNAWLKETFNPADKQGESDPANISFADGKLSIAEGSKVTFAASPIDPDKPTAVEGAMKGDLAYLMGFNRKATSNIATNESNITDIYELKDIDPTKFLDSGGNTATKLSDVVSIDGQAVTAVDGKLTISGNGAIDITGKPELVALFGKETFTLSDGTTDAGAIAKGQDSIIIVNGETTKRSGNNISIDGVSLELTKVSKEIMDNAGLATGKYEETVVTTSRDVDIITEGFKTFVEDYNKMFEKLNGFMDEEATYKEYPPLSAEQKKEMSEREVELWEKKSKVGLIRGDSTVQRFLSEMRISMYTKPTGSKYALFDIGLETTQDYKEKGKLQLDETALRNAFAADADAVKNLFTNATEGVSKQLMNVMDRAAKESSGTPGALISLAGTTKIMTKNNTIYSRISGMNDRIKDLKTKYQKERARYWQQFSSMEKTLSNFNQQSMMFSNQMGG